jgi:hypothetical protein
MAKLFWHNLLKLIFDSRRLNITRAEAWRRIGLSFRTSPNAKLVKRKGEL